MDRTPEGEFLSVRFRRERSVRRTAKVLAAKRQRIREDLGQLLAHLGLLVPATTQVARKPSDDMLREALGRLEDDAFAQWVMKIVEDAQHLPER